MLSTIIINNRKKYYINKPMTLKLPLLFLFVVAFASSFAQTGKNYLSNSFWDKNQVEFIENTVVFKIKPEYRTFVENPKFKKELKEKLLPQLDVIAFEQMFPGVKQPKVKKSKHGFPMVDLSTTYIVRYSNESPIKKIVDQIIASGMVEYAAPMIKEEPMALYVPNDTNAQVGKEQWHLAKVKAYEAWNIEKGDTNVFVGIVDSDINLNHIDLKGNIKLNYADPINGIDDDKDGYIDNFNGWDIANNDNDPNAKTVKVWTGTDSVYRTGIGHATLVAGASNGHTDNKYGIAGAGFKTKYLPVKVMKDEDAYTKIFSHSYYGFIYAVEHGCKVINLSWGSKNSYSPMIQDVINYGVYNFDVLVVASAGNTNEEAFYFPASYENVLSVAASDASDTKATFATYNTEVDICAPGTNIYTTTGGNYWYQKGSSLSAPIVAGAAALLRSKYKNFNALQISELLRVTADVIDTLPSNLQFKGKIGKGRLNMYRALSDTVPSIRMYANNLSGSFIPAHAQKETLDVVCNFVNLLLPTKNLVVKLKSLSNSVKVIDSISVLNVISTMDSVTNLHDLFKIEIDPTGPINEVVTLKVEYSDEKYKDYQYFYIQINPNYLSISTNSVTLTETSIGRLAFNNIYSTFKTGDGFVYKGQNLISESGLIVASSASNLSDCITSALNNANSDFVSKKNILLVNPSSADMETYSEYQDTSSTKAGVYITQRSYAWKNAPYDKFVILEFDIKNRTTTKIDTLRMGIYTDWDIMDHYKNKANWDNGINMGYAYSEETNGLFGGISLLSKTKPSCYSMDHLASAGNNNIYAIDGFSVNEKYQSISSGIGRSSAGGSTGYDIAQVIGGELYNILAGESKKISFAILAGDNLSDLKNSYSYALAKYTELQEPTAFDYSLHSENEFTISPNPTSEFLFVSSSTSFEKNANIQIINTLGETVMETKYQNTEPSIKINVQSLTPGIYQIKFQKRDGFNIRKFIKY